MFSPYRSRKAARLQMRQIQHRQERQVCTLSRPRPRPTRRMAILRPCTAFFLDPNRGQRLPTARTPTSHHRPLRCMPSWRSPPIRMGCTRSAAHPTRRTPTSRLPRVSTPGFSLGSFIRRRRDLKIIWGNVNRQDPLQDPSLLPHPPSRTLRSLSSTREI